MRNEAFGNVARPGEVRSGGGKSKYFRLQYLRAIAAFCVVVFHAAYYLKFIRGDDRLLAITPPNLGGFGVCLFFVISGYLMASLATKLVAQPFHRASHYPDLPDLLVGAVRLLRHQSQARLRIYVRSAGDCAFAGRPSQLCAGRRMDFCCRSNCRSISSSS